MTRAVIIVLAIGILTVLGYVGLRIKSTPTPARSTEEAPPPMTSRARQSPAGEQAPHKTDAPTAGESLDLSGQLATNYYLFSAENYEKILEAAQPHYLFFYANWCPTCQTQEETHVELFNELGARNDVIGLRVNVIDSDTDAREEALAEEYGIRFQHQMLVFNGEREKTEQFLGATSAEAIRQALAAVSQR